MANLTALKVKQLKKTGKYSDGDGLILKVQATRDPENPNKSWLFRWGAGGKNTMGLGSLKDVSLAEARTMAAAHHRLVSAGQDPRTVRAQLQLEAKKKSEALTFEEAAKEFIESKRAGWSDKKHAQQWTNTLTFYAFPEIGTTPCAEVTTEQIVKILRPIWTTTNETAGRLRGRIENVLDWAAVKEGRLIDNPARFRGRIQLLLAEISRRDRIVHHPAMPYADVPAVFKSIGSTPLISAQALLLCILTGTRTKETIQAQWNEFDLDKCVWTIPKERMKKRKEHRVPLSPQAIQVLNSITKKENSPWVFNGRPRKRSEGEIKPQALSNMAMLNYLQETLDYPDFTVHGFRSSFRDWAAEVTDHQREVIEQALAHQLADQAEAAYQRGDYMEKRKVLMNDWADYCYGVGAYASAEEEAPAEAQAPQASVT